MHDMQRDDRQLSLNESSSRYVTIYTYTQTNPARYPTGPRFGPVSPSEQPDRPGFRADFSHWRPVRVLSQAKPDSSGLEATQNPPDLRSRGFDNPRTDHMCGAMPILQGS